MSLMLAHHGRHIFRQLAWREMLCASAPASMIPVHVQRVIQATKGQNTRSNVDASFVRSIIPHIWANSYATSIGRPKAHTGKRQAKKKSTSKATDKPKSKTEETLTAEQKEAQETRKQRTEIRELKAVALTEPKKLGNSTWMIYLAAYLKGAALKGGSPETMRATFREASQKFKIMPPEELEVRFPAPLLRDMSDVYGQRYTRQAESNKATNVSAYEAWVKSYTPLQIRQANLARKKLAKLTEKRRHQITLKQIHDDRQVKAPRNSFSLYATERYGSSGAKDFTSVITQCAEEWKNLPDSQKEVRSRLYGPPFCNSSNYVKCRNMSNLLMLAATIT